MGPIQFDPTIWPPVEPTDRSTKADVALQGDKDRRIERHVRRRLRQEEQNPDADEFRRREQERQDEEEPF